MTRDRHEVDKEEEKREGPQTARLVYPLARAPTNTAPAWLLTFLDLAQLHLNVVHAVRKLHSTEYIISD